MRLKKTPTFASTFPLILDIKNIIESSSLRISWRINFKMISEKERLESGDLFRSMSCSPYQKSKRRKERLVVLRFMLIKIVGKITNWKITQSSLSTIWKIKYKQEEMNTTGSNKISHCHFWVCMSPIFKSGHFSLLRKIKETHFTINYKIMEGKAWFLEMEKMMITIECRVTMWVKDFRYRESQILTQIY